MTSESSQTGASQTGASQTSASQTGASQAGDTAAPWWRRGVVYQVYVRSYADSNGDGTGDINGLRSRLPYLQRLGVDAIWINPWYKSPLADGGYDVSDYRQIEARYGTLADAEALIAEAHDHGIRVIADLVPNHTSEQHVWFAEAKDAPVGHPSRARYHFRDGRGTDGSEPPSDWTSVFGGPAWTRLPDGQWYLHLFAPEQPDLNWENPEVRAEFEAVLRFWLDRGVDGFRIDVAHGLIKDMDFPDLGTVTLELLGAAKVANHPFWDRDGLHEIVRDWRALVDSYEGERMLVAEAWVDPDRLPLYLRPDEYHQSFNFEFLETDWEAETFADVIVSATAAATEVGSTPTWVLSNHDVMREATRYGLPNGTNWRAWPALGPAELLDVEQGKRRARAAALLLLGLPGSAYVYQGEELGLPEVWDLPPEVLDDPVWERSGRTRKGRDGCRVPLPWEPDGPSLGFGSGDSWLPQPSQWSTISAASQADDPASSLQLYTSALRLRKRWGMADEDVTIIEGLGAHVVGYRRGSGLMCIVNFGVDPIDLPTHTEILLSSDVAQRSSALAGECAVWLR